MYIEKSQGKPKTPKNEYEQHAVLSASGDSVTGL